MKHFTFSALFVLAATLVQAQTPTLVQDITTGTASTTFGPSMVGLDGILYYSASSGAFGQELWRSDGTAAGTFMIKDINPGSSSSSPNWFCAMGGNIYFQAKTDSLGVELWRTDGTAGGTYIVKNYYSQFINNDVSSLPDQLVALDSHIIFTATNGSSGFSSHGREPIRSDGTSAGTDDAADLFLGINSSNPTDLVRAGDWVYGAADIGTIDGDEAFRVSATSSADINVNPGLTASSLPSDFAAYNDTCYFVANNGTNGREIIKAHPSGFGLLKDINSGSSSSGANHLRAADGSLWFIANDGGPWGLDLWKSDGSTSNTVAVADIAPSGSSDAKFFTETLNGVVFSADDQSSGAELWVTDGSNAGTVMVEEIFPGATSAGIQEIVGINGKRAYFSASNDTNGVELWETDGTAAGTNMLLDIWPGDSSSLPENLTVVDGVLYFTAYNATIGRELWKYELPCNVLKASLNNNTFYTLCEGDSVVLEAETRSGWTHQWLQNSAPISGATDSVYTASLSGDYELVTLDTANACTDTSVVVNVTVNPIPSVLITSDDMDQEICSGDPVLFTAVGGGTYNFKVNGNSVQNSNTSTYSTTSLINGQQVSVEVTVLGCSNESQAIQFTVFANPNANLNAAPSNGVCDGDSIVFTAPAGAANYDFILNSSSAQNGAMNTFLLSNPMDADDISVVVTSFDNCTSVDFETVTVFPLPTIPVITAMGDTLGVDAYNNYRWFINGVPILGANEQTHIADSTGVYSVVVTNEFGCVAESDTLSFVYVPNNPGNGIASLSSAGIQLFPNPTSGQFELRGEGLNGDYRLLDQLGREVKSGAIPETKAWTIDLAILPAGSYTLILNSAAGQLRSRVVKL